MMYYIEFQYQEAGLMGGVLTTDWRFVESATSFDDACNQIKQETPTATNFVNKTNLNGQIKP